MSASHGPLQPSRGLLHPKLAPRFPLGCSSRPPTSDLLLLLPPFVFLLPYCPFHSSTHSSDRIYRCLHLHRPPTTRLSGPEIESLRFWPLASRVPTSEKTEPHTSLGTTSKYYFHYRYHRCHQYKGYYCYCRWYTTEVAVRLRYYGSCLLRSDTLGSVDVLSRIKINPPYRPPYLVSRRKPSHSESKTKLSGISRAEALRLRQKLYLAEEGLFCWSLHPKRLLDHFRRVLCRTSDLVAS
jgi:hypothetical protein